MKIARFIYQGTTSYGVVTGDSVQVITNHDGIYGDTTAYKLAEKAIPLEQVELLAPCEPSKVICIGLNYKDHAQELDMELPQEPLMFLKPPSAVIGHQASVEYPSISQRVDYEGELAVVMKKRGKNISPHEVAEYVLGYTCGNDITARDLQKKDGQWTRAKSFDTFMPLGPWIVTDINPNKLAISTRLNDQVVQKSNTDQMVFDLGQIVSRVSQVMTLEPGDTIITGTPFGVGQVKPGDVIEVDIESIGTLTNKIGK